MASAYLAKRRTFPKSGARLHAVGCPGMNRYETITIGIESEDIIVFYTDGLVEAESRVGEFYGEQHVETVFGTEDADEILETILGNLIAFRDNASVSDDVTVVMMVVE